MRIHLLRLTVAQLAAIAIAAVPGPAGAAARGTVSAAAVPRPLVLINGDRLGLPARPAGALLTPTANGSAYAIPAVAVPYLGRGLDPSLFEAIHGPTS